MKPKHVFTLQTNEIVSNYNTLCIHCLNNKKKSLVLSVAGFTLVEVLLAAVIGSIVAFGSLKVFDASLQSSRMASMFFAERELKAVIGKVLSNTRGCRENLKPDHLTDVFFGSAEKGIGDIRELRTYYLAPDSDASDSEHKKYSLVAGPAVLKTGAVFSRHLEIVQMRLDSIPSFTVSKTDTNIHKDLAKDSDADSHVDNRRFVIFYRKKNMRQMSTLAGGPHCEKGTDDEEAKTEDCYFIQCDLRYQLNSSESTPNICNMQTCLYTGMPTKDTVDVADDFLKKQENLQENLKHIRHVLSMTEQEIKKAKQERENLRKQLKNIKIIGAERFQKLIDTLLKLKRNTTADD